jgi:hypothetical protein
MNEEEIKQIMKDPKKLLDLFVIFHRMIHIYESSMIPKRNPGLEKLGLADQLDIKVFSNKLKEAKQ